MGGYATFLILLVVVAVMVAGFLLVVVVGGGLAALFGLSAALGFAVSQTAAPGEQKRSWWKWAGVSLLGVLVCALMSGAALALTVTWEDVDSARVVVWGASLSGGAIAGLLHVVLRERPGRWVVAWMFALGVPALVLSTFAVGLSRALLEALHG